MTEKETLSPFRTEPWWARPARLALVFVLGVYAVAVLFVLLIVGLDRVRHASDPIPELGTADKAGLALDQAERILSLLEVVIGAIALVLPLALGVIVFIFQQNRRTIEELTQKAERAETNAARSQQRVEEYREEAKEIGQRVNAALNQIGMAEERDRFRDEQARKAEEENLKRDIARDEAARELQRQIADQKREVVDVSFTAQELLNQSRSAQHKLTKVDQFLEVRRHSALCTSEDVLEATTAVLTLAQIAQYPDPGDDDDEDERDPLRGERDMLLRREALRAMVSVREAQHVPREIRDRLLVVLRTMSVDAEHKVLRLEAIRTLRVLME